MTVRNTGTARYTTTRGLVVLIGPYMDASEAADEAVGIGAYKDASEEG